MTRLLALGLVLGVLGLVIEVPAAPSKKDQEKIKEALRELQEFIGEWESKETKTKLKPGPRDPIWTESAEWNWRFKGDDICLSVDFKGAKFLKNAEIRYLLDKKRYQLTGTPVEGTEKAVFDGVLKDDKLEFVRTDPKTKQTQRIRMNTAAEGVRSIYYVEQKSGTLWNLQYMVASNKKGESLGKTQKRPECVVSGGLGTMPVNFNGETFYVCCSGCADAFKENPKKYVDEFKAKKKK